MQATEGNKKANLSNWLASGIKLVKIKWFPSMTADAVSCLPMDTLRVFIPKRMPTYSQVGCNKDMLGTVLSQRLLLPSPSASIQRLPAPSLVLWASLKANDSLLQDWNPSTGNPNAKRNQFCSQLYQKDGFCVADTQLGTHDCNHWLQSSHITCLCVCKSRA